LQIYHTSLAKCKGKMARIFSFRTFSKVIIENFLFLNGALQAGYALRDRREQGDSISVTFR